MSPRRGHCFIFSAPSGCGKSTIVKRLCELDSRLVTSVSTTTRPQRSYEIDGEHYYFVTDTQFDALIAHDEFLEHAIVFKHRYGTRREIVSNMLEDGFDVLFDIDWQGAQKIKQHEPFVASFFLVPPSLEELERRLSVRRRQDTVTSVDYRMSRAIHELSHYDEFDYVIVNDDLATTCDLICTSIKQIRQGEHLAVPPTDRTIKKLLEIKK